MIEAEQKKLNKDDVHDIKTYDYDRKKEGAYKALSDALGTIGGDKENFRVDIRYRKSKYIGGTPVGEDGQGRRYDRADIFAPITKELKKTEAQGAEYGKLRQKQIDLA